MKDGITFQIVNEDVAIIEDSPANERTNNSHRIRLDINAYKRMLEQALRAQVEFIIVEENYNNKIKSSVERMVDLAAKSAQGQIDKLVADEVARMVKERVVSIVQALPIAIQVKIGDNNG